MACRPPDRRLVEALGGRVSKDQVSRPCGGLDEQVSAFLLDPPWCGGSPGRRAVMAVGRVSPTRAVVRGGGRPRPGGLPPWKATSGRMARTSAAHGRWRSRRRRGADTARA